MYNLFKIIIILLFIFYPLLLFAFNSEEKSEQKISDFDIIDKNSDGLVSYNEFQIWHRINLGAEPKQSAAFFGIHDLDKDVVPLAFKLSQKSLKESEKIFQLIKFDLNSDGFLDINELKYENINKNILKGIFDVADLNNDKLISKKEFSIVENSFNKNKLSQFEENSGQAQSLISELDLDGDGQINIKELIIHQNKFGKIKDNNNFKQSEFNQLDINNDGLISFEELKQLPQIIMKIIGIQPFKYLYKN
ncbi:hypothetical protein Mgra_00003129 [Meloidogyne graminicola]|uniref:EF-hand domain-containing protein n=1 Tax=Meloidogyne graminicola TaxID=189291 RepID=A0A8S9ZWD9_9BILA|nr:hypothetical protein Mgra_00003129 [Meloidogyne graminicola]